MATSAVKMKYKNTAGNSWSKTLGDMPVTAMATTDKAKEFAQAYAAIVDGTLEGAQLVVTTDVELDG